MVPDTSSENGRADPRPWFVTLCFIQQALGISLVVFLLMEVAVGSSFFELSVTLATYSKLSATTLVMMVCSATVSVVAVWIRNSRLLVASTSVTAFLGLFLIAMLAWSSCLASGCYESSLEAAFDRFNANVSCPSLPSNKSDCCGWSFCDMMKCPSRRLNSSTPCKGRVEDEVKEFSYRFIPIVVVLLVASMVNVMIVMCCPQTKDGEHFGPPSVDYETISQH